MKKLAIWEVTACGSLGTEVSEENDISIIRVTIGELGTTYFALHHVCRLIVTANVVPSS
jgi:hypothetical protein